jgi:hypothetical protein
MALKREARRQVNAVTGAQRSGIRGRKRKHAQNDPRGSSKNAWDPWWGALGVRPGGKTHGRPWLRGNVGNENDAERKRHRERKHRGSCYDGGGSALANFAAHVLRTTDQDEENRGMTNAGET